MRAEGGGRRAQGVKKERARGEVRVSEAHFTAARSFFNLFLALLTLLPSLAHTQTDSTTLHGTNAEWADRTWLRLLDRGAAADGRLTDKGILLRFHENIDEEYWLDFISTGPSITENYEWWQNQNGARSGSIIWSCMIHLMCMRLHCGEGRMKGDNLAV